MGVESEASPLHLSHRGEVGSRLRDPGEGSRRDRGLRSPSPGMCAKRTFRLSRWGEVKRAHATLSKSALATHQEDAVKSLPTP